MVLRDINPNDVSALYIKGAGLYELGRFEEAIPYLDRILDIEPKDVDALIVKGLALKKFR